MVLRSGDPVDGSTAETTHSGQSFSQPLDKDNNGDEVRIELPDTVPAVENKSQNDTANHYNAIDLATQAEQTADSDRQQRPLLLFGGAVVLLFVLIGGSYYLYSQISGEGYSEL